ncbi:MAG TPA: hypothetical protein VIX17_02015 [Pyrinomonadaceae bacterium]|jgi:hypothetical protein
MDGTGQSLKVTMFFPLRDNDSNPFDEDTWAWWHDNINKLLGRGYTELGVVKGWWQGYTDENRWIIAVVQSEEEISQLRIFLQEARLRFKQEKMYLEWHSVYLELI